MAHPCLKDANKYLSKDFQWNTVVPLNMFSFGFDIKKFSFATGLKLGGLDCCPV